MTLTEFLKTYRKLSATGEQARLSRMFMLVELKPLTVVWQNKTASKWNVFLRSERLASPPYFASFEEATRIFRRPVIDRIGADAVVALARTEPHLRDDALKLIDDYIKLHGMAPQIMTVHAIVRGLRRTVVVVREHGKSRVVTKH